MTGSVSTCLALTVASAPEDTPSKEMDEAARVSGTLHALIYTNITKMVSDMWDSFVSLEENNLKYNAGKSWY